MGAVGASAASMSASSAAPSRWRGATVSHAAPRIADHDASSTVLPQPAGALTRVSGRSQKPSSASCRRGRSIVAGGSSGALRRRSSTELTAGTSQARSCPAMAPASRTEGGGHPSRQSPHLEQLEAQRPHPVEYPVERGLVAYGPLEHRLLGCDIGVEVVEPIQHRVAEATADADLVLRHHDGMVVPPRVAAPHPTRVMPLVRDGAIMPSCAPRSAP